MLPVILVIIMIILMIVIVVVIILSIIMLIISLEPPRAVASRGVGHGGRADAGLGRGDNQYHYVGNHQ